MGAIVPPIPKVEPNFFKLIKFLMCKPNKYFRQINETAQGT